MPWHHFNSPLVKWATQPSFLLGEYLFYALAIIALVHALRSGRAERLIWIGALVAGTANDVIFMALPVVDNFWQAQATIMLTARMPLYIPCVYVCFMYYPTVAVRRVGLPLWSRAALTGLAASLFYAPYDIVGAKFLWWTWHDTDRPIMQRLLGAPIGSTMWVITFVAVFAWLLNRVIDRAPDRATGTITNQTFAKGLALVAGLSSILMVLQMTVLQQLDGGVPGPRGLVVVITLYAIVAARGFFRRTTTTPAPTTTTFGDRALHAAVVVYFAALVAIGAVFDPTRHVSTSVHQTYGACHVEAKDITGAVRYEFLCAEDFDEDFTFACVDQLPPAGARWYTVCGKAFRDFGTWMAGLAALGLAGVFVFTALLRRRRPT